MKIGDTVSLAVRNLGQAKLRTTLTTLGVAIGIASLSGMVSLGVGLQEQFVGRFTNAGLFDVVTVTSTRSMTAGFRFGRGGRGRAAVPFGRRGGGPDGLRGAGAGDVPSAPVAPDPPLAPLDEAAIASIAALPHVKEVYPNIRVPVQLTYGGLSEFGTLVGIPMSTRGQGAFQTMKFGAFFESDADRGCILSLDLASRMVEGDANALVGQELTYSYSAKAEAGTEALSVPGLPMQVKRVPVTCRITGIVERDPSPGLGAPSLLSGVMVPIAQAKLIDANSLTSTVTQAATASRGGGFQSLTIKVDRSQFTQDVQVQVKALGFQTFSISDALEGAKRAFIILDIVLSLIGSIALAVSSLGIVNTMVMSILERTREIGVMKAIGGSDADVRGIFLVEASAIGMFGGILGVGLGWMVGRVINFGANIYIEREGGTGATLFSMPWWLVASAIAFSLLVSLVAGSYPAARAAKLDPIQALRHD
jgi:putative ABC transport system permease protein